MKNKSPILTEYGRLFRRKMALEEELKQVKREIAAAEEQAINFFVENSMQKTTVDTEEGSVTLSLSKILWANLEADVLPEDCKEAFEDLGVADMVKPSIHHARLKSVLKDEFGGKLPDRLNGLVRCGEKFTVRARRK